MAVPIALPTTGTLLSPFAMSPGRFLRSFQKPPCLVAETTGAVASAVAEGARGVFEGVTKLIDPPYLP